MMQRFIYVKNMSQNNALILQIAFLRFFNILHDTHTDSLHFLLEFTPPYPPSSKHWSGIAHTFMKQISGGIRDLSL